MELAIACMKEALVEYDHELPISKEEIIDLLKLYLESTFFKYNGSPYQEFHDTVDDTVTCQQTPEEQIS